LRWFLDNVVPEELGQVPQAAIIPLGRSVSEVLDYLASRESIERGRCLLGFPHPSGANDHRVREFEENFSRLAKQLETQPYLRFIRQHGERGNAGKAPS
jgi:hypothetical protein